MKFISLGSGSSGNCYFLESEGDAILIDCGIGVRTLKRYVGDYGINLALVHNILITHDHADHIKSVGSLSEKLTLPVYATRLVHQGIFNNWYVKKKVPTELIRYIEKGETKNIGNFTVTPFDVPHDSTDNAGFMIQAEGLTFTIITDCGHITDEIGPIISNTDYLIIEANHDLEMLKNGPYPAQLKHRIRSEKGHLSNTDCGNAIVANYNKRLKKIWLCHLSAENNGQEIARQTVEGILNDAGIKVGEDVTVTVLNRKTPTGPFEFYKK